MRSGRDVDYPCTSSVEGKNELSCTFTTSVCLRGVDRDIFTIFTFSVSASDYITSMIELTDLGEVEESRRGVWEYS
jgi:hypothetical protein